MTHYNSESLTPDEVQKLRQFNNTLNNFAKLNDGDTVDWEFNPRSAKEIKDSFGNDKIEFKVYDPMVESEFTWQAPISAARQVVKLMSEGKYFLRVSRTGSGQKDTKYLAEEIKG